MAETETTTSGEIGLENEVVQSSPALMLVVSQGKEIKFAFLFADNSSSPSTCKYAMIINLPKGHLFNYPLRAVLIIMFTFADATRDPPTSGEHYFDRAGFLSMFLFL